MRRVLALASRAAEPSTRLVRGLGAGVDVGAAAPEPVFYCRVSSLVTWVTVSSTRVVRSLGAGVCVYRRCIGFRPVFLINLSILFFLMKRQSSYRLLEIFWM